MRKEDQIKTDGVLDLLYYEYFEQMAWISIKVRPNKKLTRAQFL